MQAAAGERRGGDFMKGVTEDFAGNAGMDRAALHAGRCRERSGF
jgi:hypothetical protein